MRCAGGIKARPHPHTCALEGGDVVGIGTAVDLTDISNHLTTSSSAGGGIALAVIETKKKKAAKKVNVNGKAVQPAAAVSSVNAPAAVEATPIPTMMTDDQAAVWAANYPVLMDTDMHASIAASSVLLPLMNLGLTADQVKKYNVAPPSNAARTVIQSRQQDVVVPGVTMTDDQAKTYAANLKLWNAGTTSQADRNSAVRALAPIVGLRETGYQISQFGGGATDSIRARVASDFATLQATGNAPM